MSLSADVFVVDEHGEMQVLDVPTGCSDLAGFERWRTVVWGSPVVSSLGARYFHRLATGDLMVAPEEVPDFLQECALIRANLEAVAPTDDPMTSHGWYVDRISERLMNIHGAAVRAQRIGGGVLVW